MLIFLNRETTVMSKYNNSDLFQNGLANAMHNACTATSCCYVKDSKSPSGFSEVTLFEFDVAGDTVYARITRKGIVTSDCETAIVALRRVGVTGKIDVLQTTQEKLLSASDADLDTDIKLQPGL